MGDCMTRVAEELRSLVDNERGFIHKKLLGIGKTLVGAVVPGAAAITQAVGTVRGFLGGQPGIATARPTTSRFRTARITDTSVGQRQLGQQFKFANGAQVLGITGEPAGQGFAFPQGRGRGNGPCDPGFIWRDPPGACLAVASPVAARFGGGQAVMGQYGAGTVAESRIIDRVVCRRGQQLGNDGVCYNKGQISNKQRMWPAGRKPLLTGGDMRAISIASRAGRRMDLATKRLQKMGMMKKPASGRGVPTGHRAKLVHASEH